MVAMKPVVGAPVVVEDTTEEVLVDGKVIFLLLEEVIELIVAS
jgi:hypothetical protein